MKNNYFAAVAVAGCDERAGRNWEEGAKEEVGAEPSETLFLPAHTVYLRMQVIRIPRSLSMSAQASCLMTVQKLKKKNPTALCLLSGSRYPWALGFCRQLIALHEL